MLLLGGAAALAAAGWLLERLIVTDREAILMAADAAAQAVARGDVGEAMKVLHPEARTSFGDPAETRKLVDEQVKQLPLEKVNFSLRSLEIENGVGHMSADVFLIPKDKSTVPAYRLQVTLEWKKDGDAWKIAKGDSPGLSGVK